MSETQPQKRQRLPGYSLTLENVRIKKNLDINYRKAISSFATSDLVTLPLLNKVPITVKAFQQHIVERKEDISGIHSLENLLLVPPNDTVENATYKKTFQVVCEVFSKYFSVN